MDMIVSIGGCKQTFRALYDSGNTLRDPVGGRPVLVLQQKSLKELLPTTIWEIISSSQQPEEKMAQLHRLESGYRFTLLPFCSVGVASGLLLAVWSDYIEVEGRRYEKILIALSPGSISDGGGYQALWGAEERRTRHEAVANTENLVQQTRQAG